MISSRPLTSNMKTSGLCVMPRIISTTWPGAWCSVSTRFRLRATASSGNSVPPSLDASSTTA